MKPRQIYPDIEEAPEPMTLVLHPAHYAALQDALMKSAAKRNHDSILKLHQGENRHTRRAESAKFKLPSEPGLKRKLKQQRKRNQRGKMDVALRRLQRKALSK